ncbi:MAG TPA: methyl-accepting chemotaxis protein [Candidatus Polarisedimenticolia bacterium]|nr:methyl-accepting chemotaxis protein [Candidatus Polarisedimenticolia bacterium]
MTSRTNLLRRINGLKLRWKLTLAFLAMAPLIAAAGGGGLIFINRISSSVDSIAQVSAPMVHQATALLTESDEMQIALFEALSNHSLEQVEEAEEAVDVLSGAIASGIRNIRELARRGNVDIDVTEAANLSDISTKQARELVASLGTYVEAAARLKIQTATFESLIDQVARRAADLANRGEALMSSSEDSSRSIVQSGAATIGGLERILSETFSETYPVMRNAYRLQAHVLELRETARGHLAASDLASIDLQEQKFVRLMKAAREQQMKLQARASAEVAKLTEDVGGKLAELEKIALGDGGLFSTHRKAVAADLAAETMNVSVRGNFEKFEGALDQVFESAENLNAEAVTETRSSVSTALISTGVIIGIGIAVSLLYGGFSARSVARPLVQMTNVMSRLAGGDREASIPALGRGDEIGEMARSLTTIRDTGVRAARVQTALDNAASVVLMADPEGRVVYANGSARRYFETAEGDLRAVLPEFRAAALEGLDAGTLFAEAAAAKARLGSFSETWRERREFGQRVVELTLNPVVNEAGGRLGAVIEWVDLTEGLAAEAEKATRLAQERAREKAEREAELGFQEELTAMVQAAAAGDFTRQLSGAGRSGLMGKLSEGMNQWSATVRGALGEVVEMMSAMAKGDLSKRIVGEYQGELLRLKTDANATAEQLGAIVGQTAEGITTIKSATAQLSAGSQDLSARTEEQVASLEEMAASIREMSATVKQNAANAQTANQLAEGARGAAESGGAVAGSAVAAMAQIEESAQKITEIVGVIDEIAFQTNLLALNAAVEAARAGDAGRGFAVVAAEVRALAQRSSQASKEIKGLISSSGSQVKRGVELVNRAGSSLTEIVSSVKRVAEIVSEIAAASREQSDGVQQVDETVTRMEAVTQKNASLVEESTASLSAVDRQVDGMLEVVSFFNVGHAGVRDLQADLARRVGAPAGEPTAKPAMPLEQRSDGGKARPASDRWKGF